jgi:DNA-binding NarL/FixJ family response regulator
MTAPNPIRVLIVDDSTLVRHGIRASIENEPTGGIIEIVGEADRAATALSEAQHLRPDVVLLDLRLPDDSGLNVCRKLRQLLPQTCVIILTSATDDESLYGSVVAGAQGYLLKEINPAALIQAIEDGRAGRPIFSRDVATRVLEIMQENIGKPDGPPGLASLSPQERRVLEAIAAFHTNKEIAALMGLSENTVKNYIANIFEKLGVGRRAQAVALYQSRNPFGRENKS